MIRLILLTCIALYCVFPSCADTKDKPAEYSIYNEKALDSKLKGRSKEKVLKILGKPAVEKVCKECEENLRYWWYNLSAANIFVNFLDGKVIRVSVMIEQKRSKEL